MFIRAVHNRVGAGVKSFDLGARDALVLVPLVLVVIAFAVYPQLALDHSEASVERVVAAPSGSVGTAQVAP
jgi:NADH-quinone oxidoreductase subunit M